MIYKHAITTLGLGLSLGSMAPHALAQQAPAQPGAGDVQRSVTPPLVPAQRADQAPAVKVAPPAGDSAAQPGAPLTRIPVKSLRIVGATVVSEATLQALLSDVPGRSFTLAELQHRIQRIGDYYQNMGYPVARAVLPAQDIRDGVVEVLVLEGRIGMVSFENQSLIDDAALARLFGAPPSGSVVSAPELERRLLLLGDTPGSSRAGAVLQPGSRTGETDVRVQVDGAERVVAQLDLDNHGNRYTGYWRVGAQAEINSPLGLGDRLQLRGMTTDEALRYLRLGYRIPVAQAGWTVGAAWSQVNYSLGREYAALQARGWARTASVDTSYALVRSAAHSLTASVGWDHKTFEDRIEVLTPASVTGKSSHLLGLSLNGFGSTAAHSYAYTGIWSHGQLKLPTAAQISADEAGPRTRGHFNKFVLTANVTLPLQQGWSLYGSGYLQQASRNLDASEKLSLGGANGVRAYPQGEATGDVGQLATFELRYNPALSPMQLAGFVDAGHVRFDRRGYGNAGPATRTLYALGGSVTWAPRQDVGLKLMLAHRLGPWAVQSEDRDSRLRLWLQGLWRF